MCSDTLWVSLSFALHFAKKKISSLIKAPREVRKLAFLWQSKLRVPACLWVSRFLFPTAHTDMVYMCVTRVQNSSLKPRLNMHEHLFRPQAAWLSGEDALRYRPGGGVYCRNIKLTCKLSYPIVMSRIGLWTTILKLWVGHFNCYHFSFRAIIGLDKWIWGGFSDW